MNPRIVIIGSGMAGCGAAHRLKQAGLSPVVYDQARLVGGHTKTYRFDGGWVFDDGPHVSYTKDRRIQDLLAANVDGDYQTVSAAVNNYWQGYWIKHPAQCNLAGLPDHLVVACLKDFIEANDQDAGVVANYAEWLLAAYGRTFAETFPMQYTRKSHTTEAENLTTDWIGPRLYRPKLEEVLLGAISKNTPEVHYIDHFRYPTHGGFVAYLEPFLKDLELHLDHPLMRVDASERTVAFASGEVVTYDGLVSSVPLPELVSRVVGAPEQVRHAAARLAATKLVMVNVGIDREDIGDATWSYFYDQDFDLTRISYPHRFSPKAVPPGCSSIQCEIYFSDKYKPLTRSPESFIEPAIRDLRRCGLVQETDRILFKSVHLVPYGNIIFDHERASAVDTVHSYLDEIGIHYCGRYGMWGYQWTDESFISGEETAQRVLDSL